MSIGILRFVTRQKVSGVLAFRHCDKTPEMIEFWSRKVSFGASVQQTGQLVLGLIVKAYKRRCHLMEITNKNTSINLCHRHAHGVFTYM